MRQIVLDTETTGLSTAQGHRIIEIGCIEMVNRRLTGREFHRFLNPDREIDDGAVAIHGITRADLETAPRFPDVAGDLLANELVERLRGIEGVDDIVGEIRHRRPSAALDRRFRYPAPIGLSDQTRLIVVSAGLYSDF